MLIDYKTCVDLIHACHGVTPQKILHVGAHTGEEAAAYLAQGAQHVIWFEANESLAAQLQSHLMQFPMNQQIIAAALWDSDTTLNFKITNNPQSSSFFDLEEHARLYPQITVSEERTIRAHRLDTLLDATPCQVIFSDFEFINIDTQGAELAILKGMGNYLSQASVKGIYLEVNQRELYKGIPLVQDMDDFLHAHHFFRVKTVMTPEGWGDAIYLRSHESTT
jgi:FkbM family methyltransferase